MTMTAKRRLLLASDDYWPNLDGGALFERRLAVSLSDKYDVRIWAPSIDGPASLERDGRTLIYRISSRVLRSNPRYRVSRLTMDTLKDFRQWKPDVVHVHNPGWLGLTAVTLAKVYRIPVVATNHMTVDQVEASIGEGTWKGCIARNLFARYLTWFHNRTDHIVAPTEYARLCLVKLGVKTPISVISNGVDEKFFVPGLAPSRTDDGISLIYVGRLDRDKAVYRLLEVIRLRPPGHKIHVKIVGTGTEVSGLRDYASLITRDSAEQIQFSFIGTVTEAEKLASLRGSSAFITCSPSELQCIAALEAMACGLPLVAVNSGALPELCDGLDTGWLLDTNDPDALRKIFLEMVPEEIIRRGEASRRAVVARHSHSVTVSCYDDLLRHLSSPGCNIGT